MEHQFLEAVTRPKETSIDIYEVRRQNLLTLIGEKFEGNRSSFARFVDKNVNMINLCLTTNEKLRRNIGEKLARDLEENCLLSAFWLDVDRLPRPGERDALPRLTLTRSAADSVIDHIASDDWLQKVCPGRVGYNTIAMHVIDDDTMEPTIMRGDAMLVHTADTTGSGIFALKAGGEVLVRRVVRHSGGYISIAADNRDYATSEIHPHSMKQVGTLGRVLGTLRYQPL